MKYILIFGITIILSLIIIFYPQQYLAKYDNEVNIEYNYNDENYNWNYDIDNDNLILKNNTENKWTFIPNKNGTSKITFKYTNDKNETKYTIIYDFKVKNNKIYWTNGMGLGLQSFPNPY